MVLSLVVALGALLLSVTRMDRIEHPTITADLWTEHARVCAVETTDDDDLT